MVALSEHEGAVVLRFRSGLLRLGTFGRPFAGAQSAGSGSAVSAVVIDAGPGGNHGLRKKKSIKSCRDELCESNLREFEVLY